MAYNRIEYTNVLAFEANTSGSTDFYSLTQASAEGLAEVLGEDWEVRTYNNPNTVTMYNNQTTSTSAANKTVTNLTAPYVWNNIWNVGFLITNASAGSNLRVFGVGTDGTTITNSGGYLYWSRFISSTQAVTNTKLAFIRNDDCIVFFSDTTNTEDCFVLFNDGFSWMELYYTCNNSSAGTVKSKRSTHLKSSTNTVQSDGSLINMAWQYNSKAETPVTFIRNYTHGFFNPTAYYICVARTAMATKNFFTDQDGNVYFLVYGVGSHSDTSYNGGIIIPVGTVEISE